MLERVESGCQAELERVESGCQADANQAGWDAARAHGMTAGGWMLQGFQTETSPALP